MKKREDSVTRYGSTMYELTPGDRHAPTGPGTYTPHEPHGKVRSPKTVAEIEG